MLTRNLEAKPGEYLRFVWKVYSPLFCTTAAIEKDLKDRIWAIGTVVIVNVSGGYAAVENWGRDYTTWEAVVRVNRSQPAPTYGAILASIEAFNGSFSCSTISGKAFELVESERLQTGTPEDSAAKTIADAATHQAEQEDTALGARFDSALGSVKTVGVAVIFASLAYITAKLTGILK